MHASDSPAVLSDLIISQYYWAHQRLTALGAPPADSDGRRLDLATRIEWLARQISPAPPAPAKPATPAEPAPTAPAETPAATIALADLVAYEADIGSLIENYNVDLPAVIAKASTMIAVSLHGANLPASPQAVISDTRRLWLTFQALHLIYRDTYWSRLDDKHLLKQNEYRALAKWARGLYFNLVAPPNAPAEGGA